MENGRIHQRKNSSITATVRIRNRSYPGAALDLSQGGVFIQLNVNVEIGEKVELSLNYLSIHQTFSVQGEVVSKRPDGVGVKFKDLSREQQEILSFLYW